MKKMLLTVALLSMTGFLQAADDFTELERAAWSNRCGTDMQGDSAFCSCVHTLQVKNNGVEIVKINYLIMAEDLPLISDEQTEEAINGLVKLANGDEKKLDMATQRFDATLDASIKACDN